MPSGTQPLETARLRLRRFTLDDAEAMYHGWTADPEVARYMRWAPHKDIAETRETLAEWVAAYDDPGACLWALTLKDSTLIGSLGIFPADCEAGGREPAYCIGRAHWGKGYATEALAAALEYYIRDTGDTALRCCHAAANPASGRVMEKCGFVYDRDGSYSGYDGTEHAAKLYVYRPGR